MSLRYVWIALCGIIALTACRRSPSPFLPDVRAAVPEPRVDVRVPNTTFDASIVHSQSFDASITPPLPSHPLLEYLRARLRENADATTAMQLATFNLEGTAQAPERLLTWYFLELVVQRALPSAVRETPTTLLGGRRIPPLITPAALHIVLDALQANEEELSAPEHYGYDGMRCASEGCPEQQEPMLRARCVGDRISAVITAFLRALSLDPDMTDGGTIETMQTQLLRRESLRRGLPLALILRTDAGRTEPSYQQIFEDTMLLFQSSEYEQCGDSARHALPMLWDLRFYALHGRRPHRNDRRAPDAGYPGTP